MHIIGPDATTNDVHVSLTLPTQVRLQGVHVNSTSVARAWHTALVRLSGQKLVNSYAIF